MKKLTAFLFGLLVSVSAGAATFNIFGPATGILKGSATSPITTAAAWSDVQVLLTGTCNSSVFVRGDGSCVAVNLTTNVTGTLPVSNGGTNLTAATDDSVMVGNGTTWQAKALTDCDGATSAVTYDVTTNAWGCNSITTISGAALTKTDDTNVTLTLGGSPTTALVNAASITAGWTGTLAASRGGLGMSTVTDDTVAVANGTAWQSKAIADCDDTGGNHLNYDTGTNAFSCGTSGSVAGAALTRTDDTNVTLTLGGSPTTALVNAASITAGWTGTLAASRGGTGNGFTAFTGPASSTKTFTLPNATSTILTDSAAVTVAQGGTGTNTLTGYVKGSGTAALGASTTIPYTDLTGTPTIPTGANPSASAGLSAVNGAASTFMRSDGAPALSQSIAPTWTGLHTFTPASGRAFNVNAAANQYAAAFTGSSTTGQSYGPLVAAGTNASDAALTVSNQANTRTHMVVRGDGALLFGNTTDNAAYSFLGTGTASFSGHINAVLSGTTAQGSQSASLNSARPVLGFNESDQSADARLWNLQANAGVFSLYASNDGGSVNRAVMESTRSGNAVSSVNFGNTTDNPTYSFLGTGTSTFSGAVSSSINGVVQLRADTPNTTGAAQIGVFRNGSLSGRLCVSGSAAACVTGDSAGDVSVQAQSGKVKVSVDGGTTANMTVSTGVQVGAPTGGDQGAGTLNATGLYINGTPVSGGTTTTGTFSSTLTGYSSGPTCSMKYRLTGSRVDLWLDSGSACQATSNAATLTLPSLPSAIQPTRSAYSSILCNDGGALSQCAGFIDSASPSTITFRKASANTGTGVITFGDSFTASGNKGLPNGWGMTYDLGN